MTSTTDILNNLISIISFVITFSTVIASGILVGLPLSKKKLLSHYKEFVDNDCKKVNSPSIWYRIVKRLFDIEMSIVGILILSPIFLFLIVAIKVEDKGPIFCRREIYGKNGKLINYIIFRTWACSVTDTENPYKNGKVQVTKIGHLMRNTSIDYLPIFFAILKGDLTIVGLKRVNAYLYDPEDKMFEYYQYEKPALLNAGDVLWKEISNGTIPMTDIDLFYLANRGILFDLLLMITCVNTVVRNG